MLNVRDEMRRSQLLACHQVIGDRGSPCDINVTELHTVANYHAFNLSFVKHPRVVIHGSAVSLSLPFEARVDSYNIS